jgi:hypothetical protein
MTGEPFAGETVGKGPCDQGGTMHAKPALLLNCDPGALVVLLIGISAVSFLAFSGL